MIGRYGMDQLGRFLCWVVLAAIILNFLIPWRIPSRLLELVEFFGVILMYYRMLSRNIARRYQENQVFMGWWFHVSEAWKKIKFRFDERRRYRIFKCPSCGQKIRIPRGHGKVSIRCPKCRNEFIRRT